MVCRGLCLNNGQRHLPMHNCMSGHDVLTVKVINPIWSIVRKSSQNCNNALFTDIKFFLEERKSFKMNFQFSIAFVEISIGAKQKGIKIKCLTTIFTVCELTYILVKQCIWSIEWNKRIEVCIRLVNRIENTLRIYQTKISFLFKTNHIDFFRCGHWSRTNQASRWQK